MNDQDFHKLLNLMNLSPKGYRKVRKGVKKRLVRHMQELSYTHIDDYTKRIGKDSAVKHRVLILLSVSISRFFRDRMLWEIFRKDILTDLATKGMEEIRIWSAGCARGEEPYSIKINWEIALRKGINLPELRLTATDINHDYLTMAQKGIYDLSSVKEVDDSIRKIFFDISPNGNRFAIKSDLKKGINWEIRNLCGVPPEQKFDLIFLRNNILTYCDEPLKKSVFENIACKLKMGGLFIKGAHESLPESTISFKNAYNHPHIFRNASSG